MPETLIAQSRARHYLISDLCAEHGVTRFIVERWIRDGLITPLPWSRGGWTRFSEAEVERFREAMRQDAPEA